MKDETKVVKGGFRATLALLISIIALILSILAYHRTGTQADLRAEITNLNAKIKKMGQETSERMNKVIQDTGKALGKISEKIEKRGKKQEPQESGQ